jgi:predicted DNA-binding protein YlxM (UPF0122 family)
MVYTNNVHNRDYILDYLIPVISLMRKKINHTEAFKEIANKLHVTKQTVNDRCARGINLNTQQFVDLVKSGGIKQHLMNKFPERADIINARL